MCRGIGRCSPQFPDHPRRSAARMEGGSFSKWVLALAPRTCVSNVDSSSNDGWRLLCNIGLSPWRRAH
eukprot:4494668-Pyramimonas_sp.AAC.1